MTNTRTLKGCKKHYAGIAKQLLYSDEIVEKIEEATTEEEIARIMKTARIERVDYESRIDSNMDTIF